MHMIHVGNLLFSLHLTYSMSKKMDIIYMKLIFEFSNVRWACRWRYLPIYSVMIHVNDETCHVQVMSWMDGDFI
jgi:hypothetical protein